MCRTPGRDQTAQSCHTIWRMTTLLDRVGSGRMAWAREAWQDPYRVAEEVHLLMSRRNDLFRLGNGASMSVCCTGSPDGRMMVMQLVSFDRRASPGSGVSLGETAFPCSATLEAGFERTDDPFRQARARRPRVLVATFHYLRGGGTGKLRERMCKNPQRRST